MFIAIVDVCITIVLYIASSSRYFVRLMNVEIFNFSPCSVGIVRSRTQTIEFSFFIQMTGHCYVIG
jgi:hypothetical protein